MKLALAALAAIGALGALGASLLAPAPAKAAFFPGQAIEAPSLVETVQANCTTRTVRTRSGGRTVVRRVRSCRPMMRPMMRPVVRPMMRPMMGRGCRNVTTRVRQGNRTVVRTVRRCG